MKARVFYLLLPALLWMLSASFHPAEKKVAAGDVAGFWWTPGKKAQIQIYSVGKKFNGKLAWIKEPNERNGKPKRDVHNPDPSLRHKTLLGLEILKGFKYDGGNLWTDGTVYDPESGSTYSCKMTLKNYNTLEVRGYIGFSVFGRTETFSRAH